MLEQMSSRFSAEFLYDKIKTDDKPYTEYASRQIHIYFVNIPNKPSFIKTDVELMINCWELDVLTVSTQKNIKKMANL